MTSATKRMAAPFRDAVGNTFANKQIGENGMPEYTNRGLGSRVLALSQLVRNGDPTSLVDEIIANGSPQELVDMVTLLFVTRNCRGGKGEKKLAFDVFLRVWKSYPQTCKSLLALFPLYGYWKDLLLLMVAAKEEPAFAALKDELVKCAIALMQEQFVKDCTALQQYKDALDEAMDEDELEALKRKGPQISLLTKWLPRERSSFDKKLAFVGRFAGALSGTEKDEWKSFSKAKYRRQVAEHTKYLDLPEVLLAVQKEDEIHFGKIASRATMRLRRVFMNQNKDGSARSRDPKRIRLAERFMTHVVKKGLKGAQLMPHEIVEKILQNYRMSKEEELVLDAQWKDLWKNVVEQIKAAAAADGVDFNPTQMVPLCDVSGSMSGVPMNVAIAMSIGISEITHDSFKDMVLTFESQPRWHRLNGADSIVKKVRSLAAAPWGGSTNFEAAHDLILKVAEDAKLSWDEMPLLIVFSDMQFNMAAGHYSYSYSSRQYDNTGAMATMHDVICGKVKKVAARLGWDNSDPKPIVYWNLRNTGGHPVDKDTEGAVLLAGFSPSLLKLVMYGEALREEEVQVVEKDGTVVTKKVRVTPEELLRKMLDDSLYDPVREILAESREGNLLEFEMPMLAVEKEDEKEEFDLV